MGKAVDLDRRATLWVALIFAVALGLRIAYVVTLGNRIIWPDEREFHSIAIHVLRGEGYSTYYDYGYSRLAPTAIRAPGLTYMLVVLYYVGGPSLMVARIFQSILGAALVPTVYAISRALGSPRRAGLLAAVWVAIYPYYVFCAGALYPVVLSTFLLAVASLLMLRGRHRQGVVDEAAAGAFLGLAGLTVPYLAAGAPLLALWIRKNKQASAVRCWASGAVVVIACALVIAPWVVRNYLVFHRPMMTSSLGLALWQGNNAQATWVSGGNVDRPPDLVAQLAEAREMETVDIYMAAAKREISAKPGHFLWLTAGKAANFWRLYPNTATRNSTLSLKNKLIGGSAYGIALALCIVWLAKNRREFWLNSFFLCYVIPANLVTAVTVSVDRYRLPFDLYLVIFASAAAVAWLTSRRSKPIGKELA